MAEFCNQCAREIGLPEGDFKFTRKDDEGDPLTLEEGMGWAELCEGCGPTVVNDNGDCLTPDHKHRRNDGRS